MLLIFFYLQPFNICIVIHCVIYDHKSINRSRGGGTKKKVGGLTLPLNDCMEAGVQGLHSEEFHDFTCSEMHILVVSIVEFHDFTCAEMHILVQ